jgi:hypothetical protein
MTDTPDNVIDFDAVLRGVTDGKPSATRKRLRKANAAQTDSGKQPVVFRDHDLHATVATLSGILPSLANTYAMSGNLVHIAADGVVRNLDDASLLLELTQGHTFLREKNDGQVFPKLPSERATKALLGAGSWPGINEVKSVRIAPCLLPSGRVHTQGFAEGVLVLGEHSLALAELAEQPTQADAVNAAALILEVVREFPLTAEGRTTWLALVLSLIARPAVAGNVPMFAVDGNSPGVGKTLLVELACSIAIDRGPSVMSRPKDATEGKKAYFSALASGALCMLIDNVKGEPLSDETLEALLTSGAITDRILGTQRMGTAASQSVFVATGNGLRLSSDLARRSLTIHLRSREERPEDRVLPNVRGYVAGRKSELLGAALTMLRAWVLSNGKAEQTWGSFESWAQLVDGALVFAGQPSVVLARRNYRDESDDGREALRAFLGLLTRDFEGGATAAKIVALYPPIAKPEDVEKAYQGRAILEGLAGPRYTARSLGCALRGIKGRSVGGQELRSELDRNGVQIWNAFSASRPGTSPANPAYPAL